MLRAAKKGFYCNKSMDLRKKFWVFGFCEGWNTWMNFMLIYLCFYIIVCNPITLISIVLIKYIKTDISINFK
jgi:hypothetical protein